MKSPILLLLLIVWSFPIYPQNPLNLALQDPNTVRAELNELFTELRKKHPGWYRYRKKSSFDAHIDSVVHSINEPLSEIDIYRKVKPIFARVGCLHTGVSLSPETEARLDEGPFCLPLLLDFSAGKAIVWKVLQNPSPIQPGDTLSRINGQTIAEIYARLLASIPMDGYNQSGKYRLLRYTFPLWYRNLIAITDTFTVETVDGRSFTLTGISGVEVPGYADIVHEKMSLEFRGDIALIRIPSFSQSYLKGKGQHFRREIHRYLTAIEKRGVHNILLDLRRNTGGSDSHAAWLAAHFFKEPFRYWNRIEVTEATAQEIKGIPRLMYGKPQKRDSSWHWGRGGLFSKEFRFCEEQKPQKPHIRQSVYLLVDGLCLSSCADFVAILQARGKALVIGEETGGGYQGNTSGIIPTVQLQSGLVIEIPLLRYSNAVPLAPIPGRGSLPDWKYPQNREQIDKDSLYLQGVFDLIHQGN